MTPLTCSITLIKRTKLDSNYLELMKKYCEHVCACCLCICICNISKHRINIYCGIQNAYQRVYTLIFVIRSSFLFFFINTHCGFINVCAPVYIQACAVDFSLYKVISVLVESYVSL